MKFLAALIATLMSPSLARAALDEKVVAGKDLAPLRVSGSTLQVRTRGPLREFVGRDGKVFAARWRGRAAPDLRALLGRYFAGYEAALRARAAHGHSSLAIDTAELSVRISAHARRISGSAWLRGKLPEGVEIDALP